MRREFWIQKQVINIDTLNVVKAKVDTQEVPASNFKDIIPT